MDTKGILRFTPLIISFILYFNHSNIALSGGVEKEYKIEKGDTLWDISGEHLKNPFLWPNIWEKNQYIKNPDLIYPGNRLILPVIIPSIPVSRPDRIEEIEAPLAPAEATIPVAVPEEPAVPETPPAAEAAEIPEPPEIPASLYPPSHEPSPIEDKPAPEIVRRTAIDEELIYAGGYIVKDIISSGVITGSPEGRNIFAAGDNVSLSLNKKENGISAGDKLTVFKTPEYVIHPKTRKKIGKLFIPLGVIEIYRVQGRDAAGRVITTYTNLSVGDHIQPYSPAPSVTETARTVPGLHGYIIDSRDGNVLISDQNIVYLDKGAYDGVTPGTAFFVVGDKPDNIIGEIKVISIQAYTSTAIVTKSVEPFSIGSKIVTSIK